MIKMINLAQLLAIISSMMTSWTLEVTAGTTTRKMRIQKKRMMKTIVISFSRKYNNAFLRIMESTGKTLRIMLTSTREKQSKRRMLSALKTMISTRIWEHHSLVWPPMMIRISSHSKNGIDRHQMIISISHLWAVLTITRIFIMIWTWTQTTTKAMKIPLAHNSLTTA